MYQYSFANVDLEITLPGKKPFIVNGYGTGEGLINCQRRAPIATTQFGAYGDMVVSMQRILGGDLSFPILMNAHENTLLQNYANEFQALAIGGDSLIEPIQATMTDNMGADVCQMTNGVILAMPAMVRGQTMNVVTWVISFENMKFSREVGNDVTPIGQNAGPENPKSNSMYDALFS